MKKRIGIVLVLAGILDLAMFYLFTGMQYGWLELLFDGSNLVTTYGAYIMIIAGSWLYSKESALENSEMDEVNDLEPGEVIVFKHVGRATIITLTSNKIIYRAYNVEQEILDIDNVVADEKAFFLYSNIQSAVIIKIKDIKKGFGPNYTFGISLTMIDGKINNIPTNKTDIIIAHILKQLKNNR
ncbi:MAG: hypothetical protein ACKVJM_01590 [Flavobacteriales bacterium]|tara:strand:+ start:438 stop:989 length:552 start_codon:yes stop_codon:yes gene_type:complete